MRLGDVVEIAHDNYRKQKQRFAEDAQRRQDSIRAYNTVSLDTAYQDSISL